MSFVLLAAAVLFGRLPSQIARIDPGFETRQTMAVPLDVSLPPYTKTSAQAFYRELETRIQQIPNVQSLAYESLQPFRQAPPSEIRTGKQNKGQGHPAVLDDVSPDFFTTFGVTLIRGRAFRNSDIAGENSAQIGIALLAGRFYFGECRQRLRSLQVVDNGKVLVEVRKQQHGQIQAAALHRDLGFL